VSTSVDPSTIDTISTKVADTMMAVTDNKDDDEDILAVHNDFDEVTMLVDLSTTDTTSFMVTDTSTAAKTSLPASMIGVEVRNETKYVQEYPQRLVFAECGFPCPNSASPPVRC
jgi:hypothetical protein